MTASLESEQVASFWRFVLERDRVWRRRQAGEPAPWTDDPIIAGHHFTNVHRDRDPGTQWMMERGRWRTWVFAPDEILYFLVGYRTLNRVQTFEDFGLPPLGERQRRAWADELRSARASGYGIGSSRHQTSFERTMDSLEWLGDKAKAWKIADEVWDASDGVQAVESLVQVPGLGPFYAIQVVGDLVTLEAQQTPEFRMGLAMGTDPITSLAVGSRCAAMLIAGQFDPEMLMPEDQSVWRRDVARRVDLNDEERLVLNTLHDDQPDELSKPLTYVDIEHSLCEWNRYHKLQIGDPRVGRRLAR